MKSQLVQSFWKYLDQADFDSFNEVMSETAKVLLPNTNEVLETRAEYIEFNKNYPGRWYANVERFIETDYLIITVAKVSSKDESHYVTSFFEFENGMISKITEYWGIVSPPPAWRVVSS